MPALSNSRHELFAQELAKGASQSAAYEAAGYEPSEPNASRLIRNDKVASRVAEIQARGALRSEVTIASLTEMLLADRALARDLGQPAAAVSAVEKIGKLHGMFVDRSENVHMIHDVSDQPLTDDAWAEQHATAH